MIETRKIHNHGHIVLESVMGSDLDIVNAARVSFNTESPELDESGIGLINFLMRERHGTPFEMVELKFDIKAPIFVFREWHRHRTASINEMSGRYTELLNEFYIPERDAIREQYGKPGAYKYRPIENPALTNEAIGTLENCYGAAWDNYKYLLRLGIAKEVARLVLPVAIYSRMKWKCNLRNLMGFLNLRNAENAQREIREYAAIMETMVADVFPVSMKAFVEHGRVKP